MIIITTSLKVLLIYEEAHGPRAPCVATTYNNMGYLIYAEAEQLLLAQEDEIDDENNTEKIKINKDKDKDKEDLRYNVALSYYNTALKIRKLNEGKSKSKSKSKSKI